jgi:hypothetical protein
VAFTWSGSGQLGLAAVFVACGMGCASINYAPRVLSVGVGEYRDTQALDEKAARVPAADAARVKVYIDGLPEGMTVQNGRLVVDPERYEVLGRVGVTVRSPGFANIGWGFYDYAPDQSWRKAYCWWQVPLSWVTIGIWAILPPYYPCWVLPESDPAVRKARRVQAIRRAAHALGADLVVMGTQFVLGLDAPFLLGGDDGTAFRTRRPASPGAGAAGVRGP